MNVILSATVKPRREQQIVNTLRAMSISGFKTSDHAQVQGAGRGENAAYKGVCEYFEEARNAVMGR